MELDKEQIMKNKNEAIDKITNYLDSCFLKDEKHLKKTNLLSYWLKDYINYIEQEENFNPASLKKYSRGDIIKANLGFNVGNEEGGLHYCVVLDKKNSKVHSTITVVPLTSLKSNSKLSNYSVLVGNDIYENLLNKNKKLLSEATKQVNYFKEQSHALEILPEDTEETKIIKTFKMQQLTLMIDENYSRINMIEKINNELTQMKEGTIALINQITTISKLRIYNPKKNFDILSGISLSEEKMALIDEKIKKFFIN